MWLSRGEAISLSDADSWWTRTLQQTITSEILKSLNISSWLLEQQAMRRGVSDAPQAAIDSSFVVPIKCEMQMEFRLLPCGLEQTQRN